MRGFGWLGRLRGASQQRRIHQYFRYSLDAICVTELVVILAVVGVTAEDSSAFAFIPITVVALAKAVVALRLTRAGLAHYLGAAERPDRLLTVLCALTLATVAGTAVAIATGALSPGSHLIISYAAGYACSPVLLALPLRQAIGLSGGLVASAAVATLIAGGRGGLQLGTVVAAALIAVLLGFTARTSAWMLRVVDRLDSARETETRLAVAEERLRFGRDLHDILGRNLSVIALKSELAAQLAQRDVTAATAQMTEVQEIARDSQREIREVVRGYREVDLHAELAGARGVLEAAGIRCRIEHMNASEDSGALPARVQSTLGWVVREGTTNVLRHADATQCTVRVRRTARGEAILDMVNDGVRGGRSAPGEGDGDGRGDGDGAGGTGLAGLRERLAALGGSLTARAEDDTWRLVARVPMKGTAES
ncbi:sensor histidine kinase [Streptomyces radicis]|uniref:Sensor histidine kinase n=1 Tax=Streptomyces radicis TaxID=1750517 RepID=A0A3A9WES7_9ACTN|nr:histidine kinase [Streptomyces radicis]RKN11515.1 sensor histidine kinase [Streptomyces radicis]RKN26466.1 sensor histidine kinase [Streptomyces radicis]